MRPGALPYQLSKRAPEIVISTLCAALFGAWFGAPAWLARGLAVAVGMLAMVVLATRRRQRRPVIVSDEESPEENSWLGHELAGNGTPLGTYLLAFFAFFTAMLTGIDTPYALLAWAGFGLAVAWSLANAQFPVASAPTPGKGDTIH
jgi:hypothetical protein